MGSENTYSRSDLIQTVWLANQGVNKTQVKAVIECALATIEEMVKAGKTVSLREFATFKPVDRPARTGRNPATGEPVQIPARKACAIKAKFKMTAGE